MRKFGRLVLLIIDLIGDLIDLLDEICFFTFLCGTSFVFWTIEIIRCGGHVEGWQWFVWVALLLVTCWRNILLFVVATVEEIEKRKQKKK